MSMKIAFRVDASVQMGTGHFMRCLTLAKALKQHGALIRFISRNLPEYLRHMLTINEIEFLSLTGNKEHSSCSDLAHADWLGTTQKQDALETMEMLSDQSWDWLIIDHYALDAKWENALRKTARQIMVIDDIADRLHDCDMLLDQNFYLDMRTRYTGKLPANCRLLLGPRYALLRNEFRELRRQTPSRSAPVKRILVFFGGVDAENYTGGVINALAEISLGKLNADVVIGALHPNRAEIETACAALGFGCHVQTDRMAELMAAADLAIGAGGSAIWERCCLGLPALCISVAANQQNQIEDAALQGLLYAPTLTGAPLSDVIKQHTATLIENGCLRQLISRIAMQAVDGLGVSRIIAHLGCSGIEMRPVNPADSSRLFEWRNHPSIRSVSRNSDLISWETHQIWFAKTVDDKDKILLIGQVAETPVGVVRFDIQESRAEISIYLVPDADHSGQGRNLLRSAEQWLQSNRPEIKFIRACVLGDNCPSNRLFLGADYQIESSHYLKKL